MQSTPQGRFPNLFDAWAFEAGSVTDLWGLALGAVVLAFTVWVARRQIQIMNRQTAMMVEQSEATKRQEAIALEQSAIAKRQGEIAETQHQIMQEQLSAKAELAIVLLVRSIKTDRTNYEIVVKNKGTKKAQGLYWQFGLPKNRQTQLTFEPLEEARTTDAYYGDTKYNLHSAYLDRPIFKNRSLLIARLTIHVNEAQAPLVAQWHVASDDGEFPDESKFGQFDLLKPSDYL